MQTLHLSYLGILGISASLMLGASSGSLLAMWVSLELNLLSILALFVYSMERGNQAAMKYFIVQALSSAIFLGGLLFFMKHSLLLFSTIMISMGLKMAVAPLHGWFILITEEVSWNLFFLLATIQKILPLYLLLMFFQPWGIALILASALIPLGATVVLHMMKSFMAYSSIYSSAWLLSGGVSIESAVIYLSAYSLALLIAVTAFSKSEWSYEVNFSAMEMHDQNFNIFISMLSLGGLPPLVGFFAKLYVVLALVASQWILTSVLLLITGMFFLFLYVRSTVVSFMQVERPISLKTSPSLETAGVSLVVLTAPCLVFYTYGCAAQKDLTFQV